MVEARHHQPRYQSGHEGQQVPQLHAAEGITLPLQFQTVEFQ